MPLVFITEPWNTFHPFALIWPLWCYFEGSGWMILNNWNCSNVVLAFHGQLMRSKIMSWCGLVHSLNSMYLLECKEYSGSDFLVIPKHYQTTIDLAALNFLEWIQVNHYKVGFFPSFPCSLLCHASQIFYFLDYKYLSQIKPDIHESFMQTSCGCLKMIHNT